LDVATIVMLLTSATVRNCL